MPQTDNFRVFKFRHHTTHRQVRIMACDFAGCGMTSRKWRNFFDHLRIHTGERPFLCSIAGCSRTFTQKSNLNSHLLEHNHKENNECKKCGQDCKTPDLLEKHMNFYCRVGKRFGLFKKSQRLNIAKKVVLSRKRDDTD